MSIGGPDSQEIFYYVGQGPEVSHESKVAESAGVTIKDRAPNTELLNNLTGEGGILAGGVMPAVGNCNEEGEKQVHEALAGTEAVKVKAVKKKSKKTETEAATEMLDKTFKQLAVERMEEVLKAGMDARKFAVAIKHTNYSGELVNDLMNFSAKMELVYDTLVKMTKAPATPDTDYEDKVKIITERLEWYKKAEARCFSNAPLLYRLQDRVYRAL